MGAKELLLNGLKPVLTEQIRGDIASGKLKQPVEMETICKSVWKHLRTNVQTAGAIMAFRIKREEIDSLLKEVFSDLNVEIK